MIKPAGCTGCELNLRGSGFVPPYRGPSAGATGRRVLFLGESPGGLEIIRDEPFVGPAGGKLNHLMYLLGLTRDQFDIHNTISCRPPNDWLEGAPWEAGAVAQCRPNLDRVIDGLPPGSVIVPMGGTATRRVLGLGKGGFELKNFHGTVSAYGADPLEGLPFEVGWDGPSSFEEEERQRGATWNTSRNLFVVPTFHPAHLIRGAHNLTGIVLFDLQRGLDVAQAGTHAREEASLILDPPVAWFEAWVEAYLAAVGQDPEGIWLSVDIETPDKELKGDEGELKTTDRSYIITRVNFSFSPEEGITVPFDGPYITLIGRLLASAGPKCFWNKAYDLKRLWRIYGLEGIKGALLDFMDAWHALHSDVPKGLGFVAPFYSGWGAWKHLSGSRPALYGALDGVQNHRCAFGIAKDLHSQGMWDVFWRHMHLVDQHATSLSCRVGLKINRKALEGYTAEDGQHVPGMRDKLRDLSQGFYGRMQELVPEELRPVHPSKDGWTRKPPEAEVLLHADDDPLQIPRPVFSVTVRRKVNKCYACGMIEVPIRHRCKDETGKPVKDAIPMVKVDEELEVSRFFVRKPFNPGSWQQVLAYIKWAGHKPGREKGKETTNRDTIERLAEGKPRSKADSTRRELYPLLLDFRDVKKVLGNYVEGTLRKLDQQKEEGIDDERVHPTVTNNPSTLRTSYVDPNLQNVVADRRGGESLSAGYREAVEAEEGSRLVELDWSAIESVTTGWKMGDPQYIKLAYLGVHSHLACMAMGQPVDPTLPAKELSGLYKAMKKDQEKSHGGVWSEREQCKRVVHGTNYGLTPFGMAKRFRKLFPDSKAAERLQDLYFALAPKLKPWQTQTQELAHRQHYLGGAGAHPFNYKHEFWNVFDFEKITWQEAGLRRRRGQVVTEMGGWWYAVKPGEDAKRAVAFFPQSIAAGIIRETALQLFTPGGANYIGEAFYGKTPLRAIIHDSFLLEVPLSWVDWVIEACLREMTRPFLELPCPREWGLGAALRVGVGVKVGRTWARMEEVQVPEWAQVIGGEVSSGILDEEPEEDEEVDQAFAGFRAS